MFWLSIVRFSHSSVGERVVCHRAEICNAAFPDGKTETRLVLRLRTGDRSSLVNATPVSRSDAAPCRNGHLP